MDKQQWIDINSLADTARTKQETRRQLLQALTDFRTDVQNEHALLAQPVANSLVDTTAKLKQTRTIVDGLVTKLDQLIDLLMRDNVI